MVGIATLVMVAGLLAQRADREDATGGGPTTTPSSSPSPSDPPPAERTTLETMVLRHGAAPAMAPPGWSRWQASDGSMSFLAPVPDEPLDPAFTDGLWEVAIEGDVTWFYVYASDDYLSGVDPLPELQSIADGLTRGFRERRREEIRHRGHPGLEVIYADPESGYVYVDRLFEVDDRFVQLSVGYYGKLSASPVRRQVRAFLDSVRFGAVVSP